MARLDLGGLRDLWYRIDDIFCRLSEAIGSISFSGTTLSWSYANGGSAGSVDLNNTFATDTEAAGSMDTSSTSLRLKSVAGAVLSTVNIADAVKGSFGKKLSFTQNYQFLRLVNGNDTEISSVNIFNCIQEYRNTTLDDRYGASLYINGSTLQLISKDGTVLSSVTLPTSTT